MMWRFAAIRGHGDSAASCSVVLLQPGACDTRSSQGGCDGVTPHSGHQVARGVSAQHSVLIKGGRALELAHQAISLTPSPFIRPWHPVPFSTPHPHAPLPWPWPLTLYHHLAPLQPPRSARALPLNTAS